MYTGDVLFYNWDAKDNGEGSSGLNHMSIVVATDSCGTGGTCGYPVEARSNDRNNVFWTMKFVSNPSNSYWPTESVFMLHINGRSRVGGERRTERRNRCGLLGKGGRGCSRWSLGALP